MMLSKMIELGQYKKEMEEELHSILDYWMQFAPDREQGGFVGKIDHQNQITKTAPKGSVLNSRILWAFSAAYRHSKNEAYLKMAQGAFDYLNKHFLDPEFGGMFWTVDHKGQPLDTKKQIYALAFAVYGMSEFYMASQIEEAKTRAIDLYKTIVRYSYDEKNGGYLEALSRDWKELPDLRLSKKDANEKKSMNTHLHVLEAFANLYSVFPDPELKQRILELLRIFLDHMISDKHHLILFFDEEWRERSSLVSYGHDIEAAWLLQEAAERIGDKAILDEVKNISLKLAEATIEGLDEDGGLWYEYDPQEDHLIREKHSWPQAEAIVGFFNAWQISGEEKFLHHSWRSWKFTHRYIRDNDGGEWYWGVRDNYAPMKEEDKVGIWKCPYHNTRACLELIHRI
ncbi:MAG: AGE family epimerase/isomerase [Flavisolibacter sp.]